MKQAPTFYVAALDESLLSFRGRCSFIVYLPLKPKKFGILFRTLCCGHSNYILNFEMYTGAAQKGTSTPVDVTSKNMLKPFTEPEEGLPC